MHFDEFGREILDPTPVAASVRVSHKVSTLDEMRRFYGLLRAESERQGFDTPEEADDFAIDDDVEPSSPFEHEFDNIPVADVVPAPTPAPSPTPAPVPLQKTE